MYVSRNYMNASKFLNSSVGRVRLSLKESLTAPINFTRFFNEFSCHPQRKVVTFVSTNVRTTKKNSDLYVEMLLSEFEMLQGMPEIFTF